MDYALWKHNQLLISAKFAFQYTRCGLEYGINASQFQDGSNTSQGNASNTSSITQLRRGTKTIVQEQLHLEREICKTNSPADTSVSGHKVGEGAQVPQVRLPCSPR